MRDGRSYAGAEGRHPGCKRGVRANSKSDKTAAFSPTKNELILQHREAAQKIARHIIRRWGARVEIDDVSSAADIALCEAASRYVPMARSTFTTYLFYFIKGAMVQLIKEEGASSKLLSEDFDAAAAEHTFEQAAAGEQEPSEEFSGPERQVFLKELRIHCNQAWLRLSGLERDIIMHVHVMGNNVTTVAKKLGYSRGHISMLSSAAVRKMRSDLDSFKDAA